MSDIRRPSDSGHPDDLLAGHVDGTLTATERADLQAHLDGCEQCAPSSRWPGRRPTPSTGCPRSSRPGASASEAIEKSRKVRRLSSGARRWTAVAGVAAAAVLLVGLAVAVLRGPQDDGSAGGSAFATTSATQPKAASGPDSGAGSQDSAAAGRLVERQGNRITARPTSRVWRPCGPRAPGRSGPLRRLFRRRLRRRPRPSPGPRAPPPAPRSAAPPAPGPPRRSRMPACSAMPRPWSPASTARPAQPVDPSGPRDRGPVRGEAGPVRHLPERPRRRPARPGRGVGVVLELRTAALRVPPHRAVSDARAPRSE